MRRLVFKANWSYQFVIMNLRCIFMMDRLFLKANWSYQFDIDGLALHFIAKELEGALLWKDEL